MMHLIWLKIFRHNFIEDGSLVKREMKSGVTIAWCPSYELLLV